MRPRRCGNSCHGTLELRPARPDRTHHFAEAICHAAIDVDLRVSWNVDRLLHHAPWSSPRAGSSGWRTRSRVAACTPSPSIRGASDTGWSRSRRATGQVVARSHTPNRGCCRRLRTPQRPVCRWGAVALRARSPSAPARSRPPRSAAAGQHPAAPLRAVQREWRRTRIDDAAGTHQGAEDDDNGNQSPHTGTTYSAPSMHRPGRPDKRQRTQNGEEEWPSVGTLADRAWGVSTDP